MYSKLYSKCKINRPRKVSAQCKHFLPGHTKKAIKVSQQASYSEVAGICAEACAGTYQKHKCAGITNLSVATTCGPLESRRRTPSRTASSRRPSPNCRSVWESSRRASYERAQHMCIFCRTRGHRRKHASETITFKRLFRQPEAVYKNQIVKRSTLC